MIKYLMNLFVLLILSIGINSCDSSLGYDPNVQITKINKDTTDKTGDTTNNNVIFSIDSVRFADFRETVFIKYEHEPDPPNKILLDWVPYLINKNIRIDTSETSTKIWIDLDLVSSESDYIPKYKDVLDRVIEFKISFAAVLNKELFDLNDQTKNTRWFELSVKSIKQNITNVFNGYQVPTRLLILENNREQGYLKISLDAIPYDIMHNNIKVEKFSGIIWLYYKKQ